MLYRIQIDQRLDKMKVVTDAVKEVASDFIILTGTAYSGNQRRPVQIIEIEDESDNEIDFGPMIEKLKKALNMQEILVRRYPSTTWC